MTSYKTQFYITLHKTWGLHIKEQTPELNKYRPVEHQLYEP